MRHRGQITRWNDDKGYGFSTPVGNGQPVFVHVRDFERKSVRPKVGMRIEFELGHDKQGRCCASRVRVEGERAAVSVPGNPLLVGLALIGVLGVWAFVWTGKLPALVGIAVLGMSLVTFGAYAMDKSAAKAGRWRTQEQTLHLLALAGGWPGALLAQQWLRHKSSKTSFQAVFWLTVVVHIGALAWLASPAGEDVRALFAGAV